MKFFVCYNAKYIASRMTLKSAINYIQARGLENDENNVLYIVGPHGICYTPEGEECND